MRFLLDENVEVRLLNHLNDGGHDAVRVRPRDGASLTDTEVAWRAVSERRILLTRDLDFGEIVFQLGIRCPVILFRFASQDFASWARAIDGLVAARGDDLGTSFVVLDERSARLRPL